MAPDLCSSWLPFAFLCNVRSGREQTVYHPAGEEYAAARYIQRRFGTRLINDIDTVPYSRKKFSARKNGRPPLECSICREEFDTEKPIKRTPCGHFYHEACLGIWVTDYSTVCPICRIDLQMAIDERDMEQR
mmetsp:Transcript_11814/g.22049  ORF Transcript_11814/g.22049 Transcript_11814/m.22049 type:complete len:132 (-) Transcript_11814:40-435(-)